MSNNQSVNVNGIEIDPGKAQKILHRIIINEKRNIKTKQYNDTQMVQIIMKIIEEEVKCY